jgi:hypothetical protein
MHAMTVTTASSGGRPCGQPCGHSCPCSSAHSSTADRPPPSATLTAVFTLAGETLPPRPVRRGTPRWPGWCLSNPINLGREAPRLDSWGLHGEPRRNYDNNRQKLREDPGASIMMNSVSGWQSGCPPPRRSTLPGYLSLHFPCPRFSRSSQAAAGHERHDLQEVRA